jgi:AcrR family transcriptional regulator
MEPPESPPRRGRPQRIDLDAITEAVLELGTENATMRRVATRLGVSLPGLYHHVKNQDELMRLTHARTGDLPLECRASDLPFEYWTISANHTRSKPIKNEVWAVYGAKLAP